MLNRCKEVKEDLSCAWPLLVVGAFVPSAIGTLINNVLFGHPRIPHTNLTANPIYNVSANVALAIMESVFVGPYAISAFIAGGIVVKDCCCPSGSQGEDEDYSLDE